MATISFSNITSTSFEATISGLYEGLSKTVYVYLDNALKYEVDFDEYTTECGPFEFSELDPETTYDVAFDVSYPEIGETTSVEDSCTTLEGSSSGGGGDTTEDEWVFSYGGSYTDIDVETELSCDLNEYEGIYVKISFVSDGTATFETVNASDALISLSSSKYYDPKYGIPDDEFEYGGNRSGDAEFSYDVVADTTYYLFICHYNEDSYGSFDVIITPPEAEVSFDAASIVTEGSADGTTIDVYVTGLDTNYGRDDRTITWYLDGTSYYSEALDAKVPESNVYGFSKLTPGTTYTIKAVISYTSNGEILEKTLQTTYTTADPRPDYFEWDYDKIQGEEIKITAVEWNALQDNINEVRSWMGYSNYSFTSAVKGNDITAVMYNQCISAINTVSSSSLTSYKVSAGDKITAEAINNLRDFINDVE